MSTADDKMRSELRLRMAAEAQLRKTPQTDARPAAEMLHELQVHQIELEMQNEALREAQNALSESRDRYLHLYEFAPVGYLSLNADGLIAEINFTGIDLLGTERRTLLKQRFAALVVPEDRDRWIQAFRRMKQGDGIGRVELAVLRGDGNTLHARLDGERQTAGPEVGAGGMAIHLALTDITERKRAEAAFAQKTMLLNERVKELDCLYRTAALLARPDASVDQALTDAVRLLPPGWHYPDIACARIVLGQQTFATDNFRETPWRLSADIAVSGKTVGSVEVRYLEAAPSSDEGPFLKEERDLIGNLALEFGAVAERKQAETDLRVFKDIVDATDDAIISKTLDGVIKSWNRGAERLFGFTSAEVIGQSMHVLIPPDRADEEPAILGRISRGERIDHFETVRRCKDGRSIDISCTISPVLDGGGKVIGASKIARDITARKRLERELEQHRHHLEDLVQERTAALSIAKELAESANRAKTTFLANMSHELRTPLSGMMGLTDLALRRATDPKQIDHLTKAGVAARRLLGVINDILDISKIEAEKLTLEQRDFVLGEVLENLESIIGQEATAKGLQLRIDLPPDSARLALCGDPLRLGQILLNFTANAVKFTETGSVTVRVRPSEESSTDVLLRFEVQDDGIGISAGDQKRLFTAFEQADGSTTRKHGGTGLGLAISKRLAKLMGGEVGVDSQAGAGSSFWLSVRLGKALTTANGVAPPAPPAPTVAGGPAQAKLPARFAGSRVLLADDDPISQEVWRLLLADVGLAVDLAEDGLQAVDMAKRARYALMLMDVQMPKLNSVDATRALRALPGYAHTPILAMTANASDDDRQVCLDAGMNDRIGLPVDRDALIETLLKWLPTQTTEP